MGAFTTGDPAWEPGGGKANRLKLPTNTAKGGDETYTELTLFLLTANRRESYKGATRVPALKYDSKNNGYLVQIIRISIDKATGEITWRGGEDNRWEAYAGGPAQGENIGFASILDATTTRHNNPEIKREVTTGVTFTYYGTGGWNKGGFSYAGGLIADGHPNAALRGKTASGPGDFSLETLAEGVEPEVIDAPNIIDNHRVGGSTGPLPKISLSVRCRRIR